MPVKMAPTNVIKLSLGLEPNGKVSRFATQTCAIHMDKYVPFRKGNLAQYNIEGNNVIYDQEYARYIYYGVSKNGKKLVYNPEKHPLATSYWDKHMLNAEKDQIIDEIQKFVRRQ